MDEQLKRAFAAAPAPGDDPAFLARVHTAVAGAERAQRWRRAALVALLTLCAIALTPAAVALSLAIAAAMLTPTGALFVGWTLARPALR
jgi:hypothetical protein